MNHKISPKLLIPFWLMSVGLGFLWVASYGSSAGNASTPPAEIDFSKLNLNTNNSAKLMLFLHPKCSCSLASVNEMARLMSNVRNKPDLYIYFIDPFDKPDDLESSNLWQLSNNIPKAQIIKDKGGKVAKHLHAETSGSVVLYDSNGTLLFHGGITASRGHEGNSFGLEALKNLLDEKNNLISSSNVYGCGLHG